MHDHVFLIHLGSLEGGKSGTESQERLDRVGQYQKYRDYRSPIKQPGRPVVLRLLFLKSLISLYHRSINRL
jgi:hypothetical protein